MNTPASGDAKPKPKKAKRRPRTEMCIHRRLPDQYCSRCDGKEA